MKNELKKYYSSDNIMFAAIDMIDLFKQLNENLQGLNGKVKVAFCSQVFVSSAGLKPRILQVFKLIIK